MNRDNLGTFPPNGWPMKLTLGIFLLMIYSYFIIVGYFKIILEVSSQLSKTIAKRIPTWRKTAQNVISRSKPLFDSNRIRTVLNTAEDSAKNITFQLFDTDSNTVIVDNSANCIVWKQRKDFIDSTYQEIPQDIGTTVFILCMARECL